MTSSAPRSPELGGAEYFPFDIGVLVYDGTFNGEGERQLQTSRSLEGPAGVVHYFADPYTADKDDALIENRMFGLGGYRITPKGLETFYAEWRRDLKSRGEQDAQLLLEFPMRAGARTKVEAPGRIVETTIMGKESITVPAGTYETVRLEVVETIKRTSEVLRGQVWLTPKLGVIKRIFASGRVEVLVRRDAEK